MNWPEPPKKYVVVGIESSAGWPETETYLEFRGKRLTLRPPDKERAPSIVVEYEPPTTHDEILILVSQFLSSWAWVEGTRLEVGLVGGGSLPHHVSPIRRMSPLRRDFDLQYLPDPTDPRARLALAFYREALNIDNVAYKFLSLFKIVNILFEGSKAQKDWIRKVLPKLRDSMARGRFVELSAAHSDVASYLYESGRCAVAHAFSTPLVNPEDPADRRRLYDDMPVAEALAKWAIENEFGIKSRMTRWEEHLYELDGFRRLFGASLVQRLKNRESVDAGDIPTLPRLSVGLYRQPQFEAFRAMDTRIVEVRDGCVVVEAIAAGGLSGIILALNFAEERLEVDAEHEVLIVNRHDVLTGHNMMDRLNLIRGLVMNGQIEVWDAESNQLLGRTDPCLPVNIDSDRTIEYIDQNVRYIQEEIAWYEYWHRECKGN